ncbi:MAG: adenosine deaminase, partial [Actinobacteria bacterium]|nr:adenosine deaminase [Actinomycetota bacterium]
MRGLALLPKAHLHLHLTGAMRPSTLRELADRAGLPVPPPLPAGVFGSWAAFQARYDAARSVIRNAADVVRVVTDAAADDAADGCGWLEIQVDPTSYASVLGGIRDALEAVLTAAAQACIPTGVVVASSWARSGGHALRLARLAGEYADEGVVGFGLSNDERWGQVTQFEAAFRVSAEAGLLAVPHSGFYTGADHVRDCVQLLGAHRIGHGTSAAADPAVLELLVRRSVALEVCPTSYPPFGVHELSAVPVPALLDAGVPVALASDDPLLFGTGLAGQYEICRDLLGLTDHQLAALAGHSIRCSAAPLRIRQELLRGVDGWMAAERSSGTTTVD